jgi:hypothetical protein
LPSSLPIARNSPVLLKSRQNGYFRIPGAAPGKF